MFIDCCTVNDIHTSVHPPSRSSGGQSTLWPTHGSQSQNRTASLAYPTLPGSAGPALLSGIPNSIHHNSRWMSKTQILYMFIQTAKLLLVFTIM